MKKAVIKCTVKDPKDLRRRMMEISLKFGNVVYQHDRIYRPRNYQPSQNFPRLIMRTEVKDVKKPARYYLTLKRHILDSGIDIVNQIEVSNYPETTSIIHQLGFGNPVEVSRQRWSVVISDKTALYLDKLDELPNYYFKIETIISDEKISGIFRELEETLQVFGLTHDDIVPVPYFELI